MSVVSSFSFEFSMVELQGRVRGADLLLWLQIIVGVCIKDYTLIFYGFLERSKSDC